MAFFPKSLGEPWHLVPILQVKNESRASYNFRNVYFMDEMLRANEPSGFFKDIPPYLHMLQHVYRLVGICTADFVHSDRNKH